MKDSRVAIGAIVLAAVVALMTPLTGQAARGLTVADTSAAVAAECISAVEAGTSVAAECCRIWAACVWAVAVSAAFALVPAAFAWAGFLRAAGAGCGPGSQAASCKPAARTGMVCREDAEWSRPV